MSVKIAINYIIIMMHNHFSHPDSIHLLINEVQQIQDQTDDIIKFTKMVRPQWSINPL